jgi:hypothetical protein
MHRLFAPGAPSEANENLRGKGDPSKERDEFIRDYLDFNVKRTK